MRGLASAFLLGMSVLTTLACAPVASLSRPSTWGEDFIARSPPTTRCPGGTVAQLRSRMWVSKPVTAAQLGSDISEVVKANVSDADRLHLFQFATDPGQGGYWGFSGYLVARRDCIIHVQLTGYDN